MSFCLIDKVHEAWGRGYGRTTDVKSIESWWGRGSRKSWDRQVQGGGGQHGGPCVLGVLLGPQEEDVWVLIRGGAGEGFRCQGR